MNIFKSVLCLAAIACLTSCASVKYTDIAKTTPAQKSLNEGYSILAYLMKDESNVDKILWIKDASPATEELIKNIAQTSKETLGHIQNMAGQKPALNLTTRGLPVAEAETRDAISKATASTLLGSSGKELELRLLLTQVQAMNYATTLCSVLAGSDSNASRSAYLKKQSQKFLKLREQAVRQVGNS